MNSISIRYTSQFEKSLRKYRHKSNIINNKIDIFRNNPHDNRLKTHKLIGKNKGFWSFSIDYHMRIMFKFQNSKTADFINIGTHEIYK